MPVEWRIAQKRIEEKSCRTVIKPKAEAILWSFLRHTKSRLSVRRIFTDYLEENGKQVNLATIYRNLDKIDGRRHFVKI